MSSLFDLTDRVALVTGAGRGIGLAMAEVFAEHGANVLLADIDVETAQTAVANVEKFGRRGVAVRCDVNDMAQIDALFETLDSEFGRIDILANVAGGRELLVAPEEVDIEGVREVVNAHAVSKFAICQQAGKRMLAAGKGSIVNIGSIATVSALGRGHISYSLGMGSVATMTRELSTEWAARGVRVNAILPAQTTNPGLKRRMDAAPELRSTYLRAIPCGRLGTPDDFKGPALFLASDASAWVTGILLPVDGGNLGMNPSGTFPLQHNF